MAGQVPGTMRAVLLTGQGGVEMLQFRDDVPVPRPGPDELLIRVAAAGVNNTDINTRIGWYARSADDAGGWAGALEFPRIQGADCCGYVVAVGERVPAERIGERVIVATMQQSPGGEPLATVTLGSEMDGAFAEFMVARSSETHAVRCDWSDVELASIPCATSTAENMLRRARVVSGDRVVVTGASGGVGTAAIQLAKRRGARVIAMAAPAKAAVLRELGADDVVPRDADLAALLGSESVDVVADVVAGPSWPQLLDVLRRGGRYVVSGAIAGPMVELDVRTLYLKDLILVGATYQEAGLFDDIVRYIEAREIRPLVHATYPLHRIAEAQADFLAKDLIGKLVLTVP